MARGNFVVDVEWKERSLVGMKVTSRAGELCRIRYQEIASRRVTDSKGRAVKVSREGADEIAFKTRPGESYLID